MAVKTFFNLVKNSSIAQFQNICLKNRKLINKKDGLGRTLLHYAVYLNKMDFVKFILKQKANVNIFDNVNHLAISYGRNKRIEQLLLKHRSFPKCTNELHIATIKNDLPKMKKLLKENPSLLNGENSELKTPLFFAVKYNRVLAAKYLVEQGAFVYILDFYSRISKGKTSPLAKYLILKGTLNSSKMKIILTAFRHLLIKEKATANKLNKKLVVLMGEYHNYLKIEDLETKMLKVAKELGISKVHLELPPGIKDLGTFEKNVKSLGFKINKVDRHLYRDDASVQERNIVIADLINLDCEHSIYIGGSAHLNGLLESKRGCINKDNCHIVPLNLTRIIDADEEITDFFINKNNVIQVTDKGLSSSKPVITKWNRNIPFTKKYDIVKMFTVGFVVSVLSLPSILAAIFINLPFAIGLGISGLTSWFSYGKVTSKLETFGLKKYRHAKPEKLEKQPVEKLRAFLDGTKETYAEQFKSNFIYRDWYYRKDYYAGRIAARTEETDLIKRVRKCAARAA